MTWIACLIPLARLVYGAVTNDLGADPTSKITLTTGYTTLMMLTITLAITPVRRLSPRLNWLIKFRRLLGLFAFFYATLHLATYIALYANFDVNAMIADIARRRFITVGLAAWLLLLPLAATAASEMGIPLCATGKLGSAITRLIRLPLSSIRKTRDRPYPRRSVLVISSRTSPAMSYPDREGTA